MCHGYEWELLMLKQKQAREIERRNREKAAEESRKAPAATPAQPAPSPARNEDPVPA
jgi:hypothetical protein